MGNRELVELVAESCRILGRLGLSHGAAGHVSYRPDDSDTILIKGRGAGEAPLRHASASDIVEVNFDAKKVAGSGEIQPPSETYLHLWLYRKNPEIKSIVHVHPQHAVLLTICKIPIVPIYGAFDPQSARMAVDGVPVYDSSITVHDDVLGERFADFMQGSKVSLMRGHGITVVGGGVEEATDRAVALNRLVTMTYLARALGEVTPLPSDEIEAIRNPNRERGDRGPAVGDAGMRARWRGLQALADEGGRS
jgi:ribulose-5-phosphate 4-epimerase/fuculose-1-phosphate aldolase